MKASRGLLFYRECAVYETNAIKSHECGRLCIFDHQVRFLIVERLLLRLYL